MGKILQRLSDLLCFFLLVSVGFYFYKNDGTTTSNEAIVTTTDTVGLQRPSSVPPHLLVNVSEKIEMDVTVGGAITTQRRRHLSGNEEGGDESTEEAEDNPAYAVLFPSFSLTIGVIIYYVLTRYARVLPYTGVMFLVGVLIGLANELGDFDSHISKTVSQWININGEVLLLTFLPGLIFKDAMGQNVHLFLYALGQLLNFAFPMVLAGTVLTALVAFHIFPFGWSFDLCMTFGAILAATDPVAVAALLEEVGAPPRLKVHVAGESLLNDGSAIVFFFIFFYRFLFSFGIEGVGKDFGWADGIGEFFKRALGGAALGLAFGLMLLIVLYILNRRLSREENVVQVCAVIAFAYLNFYVADLITATSGVIATVVAGLTTKLGGGALINDPKLLDDFMALVEHILNTILFALGGILWGTVIAEGETDEAQWWGAKEWGYLILLYVLLTVIRAVTFIGAYPITVRIGLKTNWKETLFQIYGGLRGAVGIALAIVVESETTHYVGDPDDPKNLAPEQIQAFQLYGMVGGIAFMTLAINGITAGPLLIKLGLAESTETRAKITSTYEDRLRCATIQEMVQMLTQKRSRRVNFALVKHHIPYLANLTKRELLDAVERYKDTTPEDEYKPPFIGGIWPYLEEPGSDCEAVPSDEELDGTLLYEDALDEYLERDNLPTPGHLKRRSTTLNLLFSKDGQSSVIELRLLFLSILRAVHEKQVADGELEGHNVLQVSMEQSLDFAEDAVSNGEPLDDYDFLVKIHTRASNVMRMFRCKGDCIKPRSLKRSRLELEASKERIVIERSLAVMAGHSQAQKHFHRELSESDQTISKTAKIVMDESREQYRKAAEAMDGFDHHVVETVSTHKFCKVLLNSGIDYFHKLVETGLLKESEAEPFVEHVEHYLHHTNHCHELHGSGETKKRRHKVVPEDMNDSDYLTKDVSFHVAESHNNTMSTKEMGSESCTGGGGGTTTMVSMATEPLQLQQDSFQKQQISADDEIHGSDYLTRDTMTFKDAETGDSVEVSAPNPQLRIRDGSTGLASAQPALHHYRADSLQQKPDH